MNNLQKVFLLWTVALLGSCLTACSEKDEWAPSDEGISNAGRIRTWSNLDATAYDKWTYVNLETGEYETHTVPGVWEYNDRTETKADEPVTIDWHIAFHRYDIRTNGGEAVATDLTDLEALTTPPATGYTADETVTPDDKYAIVVDMSGMMNNNIGYAQSASINRVLRGWIKSLGGMPPAYELNHKVYVVRYADGTHYKIQFTAYKDAATGTSGKLTFAYALITDEQ